MPETILLVEDNPDDVLFLCRAFQKAGVGTQVHAVNDGQQAIDYLSGAAAYGDREKYPLPTLLLLDLKLPHVPGREVLRWLRTQPALEAIIVVILTSSDHQADVREAYTLGANSFLTKPSNPDELPDLVRLLVEYWFKRNVAAEP